VRKSRQYEEVKKSSTSPGILLVVLVGIAVYFFIAGSMGKWVGENVISPVFSFFEESDFESIPKPESEVTPATTNETQQTSDTEAITKSIKTPHVGIFALQTGAFSNIENAKSAAQTLKAKGGAGYVIKDEDLSRVLISCYLSNDEAVNVMARLDTEQNILVRQFEIKIEPVNIEIKADEKTIASVEAGFNFIPTIFEKMQDISYAYDGGELETSESIFNDLMITLKSVTDTLESETNGTNNQVVLDEINLLKNYHKSISEINLKSDDRVVISSQIKYTGLDIIYGYKSLIDSF